MPAKMLDVFRAREKGRHACSRVSLLCVTSTTRFKNSSSLYGAAVDFSVYSFKSTLSLLLSGQRLVRPVIELSGVRRRDELVLVAISI